MEGGRRALAVTVGPVLAALTVLCLAPLGLLFVYSFFHVDFVNIVPDFSLHNYAQVLSSGLLSLPDREGADERRDDRGDRGGHRLSGRLLHSQADSRGEGGASDRASDPPLYRRPRAHLRLAPHPRPGRRAEQLPHLDRR